MRILKISIVILFLMVGINTFASTVNDELMTTVKKILPSTEIKKITKTEIPSMLAVLLGNNDIIYVYPPKELVFLGEIYNKNGVSLTEGHSIKLTEQKNNSDSSIELTPLFGVSTKIKQGNGKYGFIVFTDPDCPFCQKLENFLLQEDLELDYIFTPLDNLHPRAREKSINLVMEKSSIGREDAVQKIKKGETLATQLGLNGTPQTLIYDKESKKYVGAISGADIAKFQTYITKEKR